MWTPRQRAFLRDVRGTIERHRMLEPGMGVLVGVSGGADSVALLRALAALREECRLRLSALHVDHGLRAGGREEARFVRRLSAELGVEFAAAKAAVRSRWRRSEESLEEAARRARYACFREALARTGAQRLALGHQADDQTETVLMRLLDGTGLAGLGGIPPVREGWLIRPLLERSRAEVELFLREGGWDWLEDPSNRDLRFRRNRVRHLVLPWLGENYNPRVGQALVRLARQARETEESLEEGVRALERLHTERQGEGLLVRDLAALSKAPAALRFRLWRRALAVARGGLRGVTERHLRALDGLALGGAPAGILPLPEGMQARRSYGRLILEAKETGARGPQAPGPLPLPEEGEVHWPELGWSFRVRKGRGPGTRGEAGDPSRAHLDADLLGAPLMLRTRRPGDRFHPLGAPGPKKLKDFFIDRKVPRPERDRTPLLAAGEEVAWVVGHRISERFKLRPSTRKVLILEAHRLEMRDA
ncbi:MAG: tRNA lysidine(34) synthetase TilS [Nitrospinota bacterium]